MILVPHLRQKHTCSQQITSPGTYNTSKIFIEDFSIENSQWLLHSLVCIVDPSHNIII